VELLVVKIAIMQPYFFPYIGYFQLINAVDEFVVYDNIEYTKKGWINRNRILLDGKDSYITLPLKRDSDYLDVKERRLAGTWPTERNKILSQITGAYGKAPYFNTAYSIIKKSFLFEDDNLFNFLLNSLFLLGEYLEINTPFLISSTISIDHELKSEKKVLEICKARGADKYYNPIGGVELYSRGNFKNAGLDLFFLKTNNFQYRQFNNDFIPFLSIIDVMMFNSREKIKEYLDFYHVVV
jgi:WbqC-like protein family